MINRSLFPAPRAALRRWSWLAVAVPLLSACGSSATTKPGASGTSTSFKTTFSAQAHTDIDILFMIDNSSEMTTMQQKLLAQLPTFMQTLQALPLGLPSVQIAVVSSDMGAPSDQGPQGIGCSNSGDNGNFYSQAQPPCTMTTLDAGSFFVSDDSTGMTKNFSLVDPAGISTVLQCLGALGSTGCGFEHQLASIDRALGADGQGPAPSMNSGFIREGAYLGIIILTNEDDCSAPASGSPLPIYSLSGASGNDLETPDGPLANYRCNGGPLGGHLCQDLSAASASTAYAQPPLRPPADATGTAGAPELVLSNCESNDTASSGLTPVSHFVADIKALKPDPEHQIFVSAIAGPATPYVVRWAPGAGPSANELWPEIEHSCTSANGDGSFADPGVRIGEFVHAFRNGVLTSICDNDYATAMTNIAQGVGALVDAKSPCITYKLPANALGHPDCAVTSEAIKQGSIEIVALPDCLENGNVPPCWTLAADATSCPDGGLALTVSPDPSSTAEPVATSIECQICQPGSTAPGC